MDEDHGKEERLARLMAAYQGGDAAAFESLYGALAPELGGYLRALCRDATRAQDLLQDTFLQVHKARHTYLPPRPVRPWLYAIARNVFLMARRAAARRGRHETLADEDLPELPVPPEVAGLAERHLIRRAVAGLADDRREALILHHVYGLSFGEIAASLGITAGAAKVRAHRAMVELRERLRVGGVP